MGIRRWVVRALELQQDVALNEPSLHLTGSERLVVENHDGLRAYDEKLIRIACGKNTMEIAGDHLLVRTMNSDDILITGRIDSLRWLTPGGAGP